MKKNWWNSLRIKIVAWSFIPTVIILSAVAWFTFYSYQKVIGDLAIKADRDVVQRQWGLIMQGVGEKFNPINVPILLNIDTNLTLPLETRAQNILDRAQGLEVFDGGIYFLDGQGKVFKTVPEQPELLGQDWSNSPAFRWIQAQPNYSAFTDIFSPGTPGMRILCSVLAMLGQKVEAAGGIYLCFSIQPNQENYFYHMFADVKLDPNLYVLDRNHQVVYSPDASVLGKDFSSLASIEQLAGVEIKSERFRIGAKDMLVTYFPYSSPPNDSLGWVAIKEESWAEIMQPTLPYRKLLIVLLGLGVIVPALVTTYGVRHITIPIQKLIRASAQVTEGDFTQQIEVKTGDEIETLADQFNLMSSELDESYSSLEKKVADRTRELAILNSIISVASHSLNIQEILEESLNQTVEQMGFDVGAAFRIEKESNSPILAAQWGIPPATTAELASNYELTNLEKVVEHPPQKVMRRNGELRGDKQGDYPDIPSFNLMVSVPLRTKGQALGLFLLGRREGQPLAPEELSLLESIGKQVGVAMENAHLYEQAEQSATAAERTRLAHELHDAVTQTLFSANLIADVIPQIWRRNPEKGMQNLEDLRQLTRGALAEMRTLLLEMRPESLEQSDLKILLTQLAEAFTGRARVPVSLVVQGEGEIPQEVKLVFYRTAQEALNNIAKHSGARQVEVHLDCRPEHLHLCVQDDGLGFEPGSLPPGHLGIAFMKERASAIGASLKIESQPGQGTIIELDWRAAEKDGGHEYSKDYPGDGSG